MQILTFSLCILDCCRSQWPRGLRCRFAAARMLRSWFRIPPGAWMFVCCDCCVLSGSGLCDELITRPEESYRVWYVVVFDLETSRMRRPWPALGRSATSKKFSVPIWAVKIKYIFFCGMFLVWSRFMKLRQESTKPIKLVFPVHARRHLGGEEL